MTFQAVPTRQGISVAVEQESNGLVGTVIASEKGNVLRPIHRGSLADALARGEQASREGGFEGYYQIDGADEIKAVTPAEYAAATKEIARQSSALQYKAGGRWGFDPSFTSEEVAAMPAAQAHVARLLRLSDTLQRALSL
jgi:hypothetical protein